eukprot:CAMPEP_0194058704 /NCGR_PEP_ID=MMETSP0009_2-20130614/67019_1 /TAXON_ID=210454 /ORGANISM="Grammatophora oceanica, Strain CCMP 410" /LENGTH=230 /DNA_ID=CAMNT_0038708979 /DNA_START=44 /DNA_END=736 /DNA_ORIENTATION=-
MYLGKLNEARDAGEKCWKSGGFKGALPYTPHYFLVSALTALDMWKSNSGSRSWYWRKFHRFHNSLIQWRKKENINTLHLVALLDAELLSVKKRAKPAEVKRAYDVAISHARRSGFAHDAALASERCGKFHVERNDSYWAQEYINHARTLYVEWNATAKVRQLDLEYNPTTPSGRSALSTGSRRSSGYLKGRSRSNSTLQIEEVRNAPILCMAPSQGDLVGRGVAARPACG